MLFSELRSSTNAVSTVDFTQSLELPLGCLHDGDLNAPMDADAFHVGLLDVLAENFEEVDEMMPVDPEELLLREQFRNLLWGRREYYLRGVDIPYERKRTEEFDGGPILRFLTDGKH